jgi:hypothetical protein
VGPEEPGKRMFILGRPKLRVDYSKELIESQEVKPHFLDYS